MAWHYQQLDGQPAEQAPACRRAHSACMWAGPLRTSLLEEDDEYTTGWGLPTVVWKPWRKPRRVGLPLQSHKPTHTCIAGWRRYVPAPAGCLSLAAPLTTQAAQQGSRRAGR